MQLNSIIILNPVKKPFFMRLLILVSTFMVASALIASGAQPQPRPYAGRGLLIMRHLPQESGETGGSIILYREPGIGRIAEKLPAQLPLLSQVLATDSGEYPAAVMIKKGAWLKIAYDEAGREGWLEMQRGWDYYPWEEFLPGRAIRLLPGLKQAHGIVRKEPSMSAGEARSFSQQETVRAGDVQGEWLLLSPGTPTAEWLRWRDESGRFLVSLPDANLR